MKILILARAIPPYICVPGSTQRVVLFSRYLTDKGHKVGLIGSTRLISNYGGLNWWNKELDKVEIYPLVSGKLLKYMDSIKGGLIKKKFQKNNSNEYQNEINFITHKNEIRKQSFKNIINYKIFTSIARKIYYNFFIFGDDGVLELSSLKIHLNRVLNTFKPDVIIVSVPPHSWLRIIPWLKNKYSSLPLIIDFRDGWTSTGIFRAKSSIRRFWQDYIEKKVILSADGVIFMSLELKRFYLNKYDKSLPYSEIIFNGYSKRFWNNINEKKINTNFFTQKHRPCIIKYVGSISFSTKSFRSPYNIFLALESCLEKKIILNNDFILSFTGVIGNVEALNDFPLLKKNVWINNPVSPLDALKEMKTADSLLLIHKKEEGAEEVLTGKIFDYIRAEKPILAITTNNCGIKKFLDNLGIGIWANINDISDISKKIKDILKTFRSDKWHEWSKKNTLNPSGIGEYSREYQYQKFENFIEIIVNEKK